MSYASMATGIVGSELQGWASLLDKWAMQDAYQKENQLQQGYINQSMGNFYQNLPSFGSAFAQQDLAKNQGQRENAYAKAQAAPMGYRTPKTSGFVKANTAIANKNSAKLGSYGDWLFDESQNQIAQQRKLAQIQSFASGQANNVFPYQMYKAQHSWDDMAAIGQAIQSMGGSGSNLSSMYNQTPQNNFNPYGGGGGGMTGDWNMGAGVPSMA